MNEYRFTFTVDGHVSMPGTSRAQAQALVEQSLKALHPTADVEVHAVLEDTPDITEHEEVTTP